jgi:hypothetical protein
VNRECMKIRSDAISTRDNGRIMAEANEVWVAPLAMVVPTCYRWLPRVCQPHLPLFLHVVNLTSLSFPILLASTPPVSPRHVQLPPLLTTSRHLIPIDIVKTSRSAGSIVSIDYTRLYRVWQDFIKQDSYHYQSSRLCRGRP